MIMNIYIRISERIMVCDCGHQIRATSGFPSGLEILVLPPLVPLWTLNGGGEVGMTRLISRSQMLIIYLISGRTYDFGGLGMEFKIRVNLTPAEESLPKGRSAICLKTTFFIYLICLIVTSSCLAS